MTTKPTFTRSDFVRQRRTSRSPLDVFDPSSGQGRSNRSQTASRTAKAPVTSHRSATIGRGGMPARRAQATGRSQNYDIAFSVGRTAVRAPAVTLSLPDLGPRWVSAGISLALFALLFMLWNSSTFAVSAAELSGAQRLTSADVDAAISLIGEPIFKAVPAEIADTLRAAYPDISEVKVRVTFPNRIKVEVVERAPVLAWNLNGTVNWIDANGVSFLPRGSVEGLIQVAATAAPDPLPTNPDVPFYEQAYLDPQLVGAMVSLAPYVPAGTPMSYDPLYGIGWQDPQGWFVYFGQNTSDIPMKLVVYQAIVETLPRQGVQPDLISVEFLDAPFYK
jgi:hypothetical protein